MLSSKSDVLLTKEEHIGSLVRNGMTHGEKRWVAEKANGARADAAVADSDS